MSRLGLQIEIYVDAALVDKEHWEPTIQRLFEYSFGSTIGSLPAIREAWAFDWQTHGDSAVLNAEALSQPYSNAS